MKNFHKQKDYWKPCRPGTIRNVSDSKYLRDRRRFIVRTAMGSVVAGLGLFVGWFVIQHDRRKSPGNAWSEDQFLSQDQTTAVTQIRFSCNDIMERMDDYLAAIEIAKNSQSVDQRVLVSNFKQHLAVCDLCTELVTEAMQS